MVGFITEKKILMNEVYDCTIVATRVVVAGYVAKKVGVSLGIPSTLECGAKLGIGIVTATVHVKWAQDKYYLPVNVFKIP